MRRLVFLPILLSVISLQAQVYYGTGYTIIDGLDGGDMDLNTPVYKTITAATIGSGLEQLLEGSGWTLAAEYNADPAIWRLYSQPYPEYKRTLHPIPLGKALEYLSGDAWDLVVDPVNRLISFEVNQRYLTVLAPVSIPDPTLTATETELPATISIPANSEISVGEIAYHSTAELSLNEAHLRRIDSIASNDTPPLKQRRIDSPLNKPSSFSPSQSSSNSAHSVQAEAPANPTSGLQLKSEGFDMGIFLRNVQSKGGGK